ILASDQGEGGVCRPFDVRRNGTLLGEGAGAMVLEAPAHAIRRGAQPLAIVHGFGQARESYSMIRPDPSGAGVTAASRRALRNLPAGAIGWVKSHGTGTILNDAAECQGMAALFGPRLRDVPITSMKGTLGHCL